MESLGVRLMKCYHWFLLLCCLPTWLSANEILDNFLQGLHTLQAQFEQDLLNEKGDLVEKSQGKMFIQRPNQFNWEYKKPYTQLIVADGKNVWIYDQDLEQITMKSVDKTVGKTPAFLLSRKRNITEDFLVKQLPNSNKTGIMRFELTPKDTQSQFDLMRISISGKKLFSFELVDNLGQTTHIRFTQVKRNRKLAKSLFIFTPPAGVDVIIEDN